MLSPTSLKPQGIEQEWLLDERSTDLPFVSVDDEAVMDEKDPAESTLSLSDEEEVEDDEIDEIEPFSLWGSYYYEK